MRGEIEILITPRNLELVNDLLPEGFEMVYKDGFWLKFKLEKAEIEKILKRWKNEC